MTTTYQTSLTPEHRRQREERLAVGRRFRKEIAACVSAYADASIAAGRRLDVHAHVYEFFPSESIMILQAASRAADVIRALDESNFTAYGITREAYDAFAKTPSN